MSFLPTPMSLRMTPLVRYVKPETICWDDPDDMYLVGNVAPGDGLGPLPTLQPFEVTGPHKDANMSYATLSIKARDCLAWEPAFVARRLVNVTLNVDGTPRTLQVRLSYS